MAEPPRSPSPKPTPGSERRAWVRLACDLETSCHPSIGGDDMRWSARVQDISRGGARLLVDRRFEPRTILNIEVEAPEEADVPSSLMALVVHVSARSDGKWSLGCRFARPLTEKELESLLKLGPAR